MNKKNDRLQDFILDMRTTLRILVSSSNRRPVSAMDVVEYLLKLLDVYARDDDPPQQERHFCMCRVCELTRQVSKGDTDEHEG